MKVNKNTVDVLEWFSDSGVSDICVDRAANAADAIIRCATERGRKGKIQEGIRGIEGIQGTEGIGVLRKEIATLAELKEAIQTVEISLKDCAKNLVLGVGNEHADILLVGEAPGAEEDKQGIPFVGQSGQLLDKILASVGLDRTKVYITNILPWRPPGNRTPTLQEVTLFRPYVIKHISLVNPKIIVCLGGTATKALLQTNQSMTQLRGKWAKIDELPFAEVLPTFHPAYLLRSPSQKREAWIDFLLVKDKMSKEK